MSPTFTAPTHVDSRLWFSLEHHGLIHTGPESPKSFSSECIDIIAPTNIMQGELETVLEMPLDILYEIFSHLHPRDLLNLSRTARSLRDVVTTRHSKHMWKSSLANVRALPPCPSDLTEIQYASLAFDNHCHFCLAPDVPEAFWSCRVRSCTKCIPRYFYSEDELEVWIPEDVIIEKPDSIFPYITSQEAYKNGGKSRLYFFPTAKEYLRELDDILLLKDDKAFAIWIQKKQDIQTRRISHAQLCRWLICRPPQQANWHEEIIVLVLVLFLAFLWRNHITSIIPWI